jgi:hypothetical protein
MHRPNGELVMFELGQMGARSEAFFFARLGYTITVSTWDGKCYKDTSYIYPKDVPSLLPY